MEWIKLWTKSWINGSGRLMTAEKRGIWADLLALAGEAKLRDGTLRYNVGQPMELDYIATVLHLQIETLEAAIDCFKNDINFDDGESRIKVWEDGTIQITNFDRYQSISVGKKKLTGRELQLWELQTLNRLANKHPIEAMNVDKVKEHIAKVVEDSNDDNNQNAV